MLDRYEFINRLNCQSNLSKYFDEIMEAYNIFILYNANNINYNISNNTIYFNLSFSSNEDAILVLNMINNITVHNYARTFIIKSSRLNNTLNISINTASE